MIKTAYEYTLKSLQKGLQSFVHDEPAASFGKLIDDLTCSCYQGCDTHCIKNPLLSGAQFNQ